MSRNKSNGQVNSGARHSPTVFPGRAGRQQQNKTKKREKKKKRRKNRADGEIDTTGSCFSHASISDRSIVESILDYTANSSFCCWWGSEIRDAK